MLKKDVGNSDVAQSHSRQKHPSGFNDVRYTAHCYVTMQVEKSIEATWNGQQDVVRYFPHSALIHLKSPQDYVSADSSVNTLKQQDISSDVNTYAVDWNWQGIEPMKKPNVESWQS